MNAELWCYRALSISDLFAYANLCNATGFNVVCETPLVAHTSPIVVHAYKHAYVSVAITLYLALVSIVVSGDAFIACISAYIIHIPNTGQLK